MIGFLFRSFAPSGWKRKPIVWDDPGADWGNFDQVIRSCWNYHLRAAEVRLARRKVKKMIGGTEG
jgi:hypothetical protein